VRRGRLRSPWGGHGYPQHWVAPDRVGFVAASSRSPLEWWCEQHDAQRGSEGAFEAHHMLPGATRRSLEEVDYFCGHGTATRNNDLAEGRGIRALYNGVPRSRWAPMSSLKPIFGHNMVIEPLCKVLDRLGSGWRANQLELACRFVLPRYPDGPGFVTRWVSDDLRRCGHVTSRPHRPNPPSSRLLARPRMSTCPPPYRPRKVSHDAPLYPFQQATDSFTKGARSRGALGPEGGAGRRAELRDQGVRGALSEPPEYRME
jgi:hypothetical protein